MADEMKKEMPDFKAMHKRAFRTAFNYLEDHWPPQWDAENYWIPMADTLGPMVEKDIKENPLEEVLLCAVYRYLGDALKIWWSDSKPEEEEPKLLEETQESFLK